MLDQMLDEKGSSGHLLSLTTLHLASILMKAQLTYTPPQKGWTASQGGEPARRGEGGGRGKVSMGLAGNA